MVAKRRAAPVALKSDSLVLTVPDAGKLLGLSRWSAYAAAKSGQLPTIRFGNRLVVPKPALQRLLDGTGTQPQK